MRPRFSIPLMVRTAFAEFVGTYVLVVIGNGSVAQAQLTHGQKGSASIFANYPAPYSSAGLCLVEEILATMIFMLVICVTTDKRYTKIPAFLQPLFIGFALLAIGISYGANSGYALNPARDLGPRITSYLGGWGTGVFSFRDYNWFWIFIVGPHIGAILGVCIFQLLLKLHQSNALDLTKVEHDQQIQRKEQEQHDIELNNIKAIHDDHHAHAVVELPRIGLRW